MKASEVCELVANNKLYKKGLEDAWELARQVVFDGALGGMSNNNLRACFGLSSEIGILRMDAIEAMQKYEEWRNEKKEKQSIQVGDVITVKDSCNMVVIEVSVTFLFNSVYLSINSSRFLLSSLYVSASSLNCLRVFSVSFLAALPDKRS